MHVHAGTGGHYTTPVNLNEDLSGTSSFSSSSKRQRLEADMRYHSSAAFQNMLNLNYATLVAMGGAPAQSAPDRN